MLKKICLNAESENSCVKEKKEKEKKSKKKDKENGSGSGEAGNHNDIDAPDAVVSERNLIGVVVVLNGNCDQYVEVCADV